MNGNADQELHHHHLPSINEITNNTTAKKHVENCDSGWGVDHSSSRLVTTATAAVTSATANNSSIKDSYKADLFEEDDLGFDPFHETQKALAEMLESESKQQQQQQQQQQQHRHLYQQQQSAPPFTHQRQTNESPPLQNLRHESPVMNRNPGMMGGLRGFSNDMGNHLNNTSGAAGRVKQPPPGFAPDPLSTLLGSGTNGQQQNSQRSLLSPGKAFFIAKK